ncbi:MAG: hypothetical protein WCV88_00690 [Patescibacteria group bacterium]|jgi:hypothetical protein
MALLHSVKPSNGYTILVAVILISAVALIVATTLALTSINSLRDQRIDNAAVIAQATVNGCGELALLAIQQNTSFTGTVNTTVNGNACTYIVTNTGGSTRTVTATATYNTVTRNITILVNQVTPNITFTSWLEN